MWHSTWGGTIIAYQITLSQTIMVVAYTFMETITVYHNIISSNVYEGIELWGNNNSISNNNISNNRGGIYLGYSNNNSILNNNISSNDYGIYLRYSNNNSISKNNISNSYGIYSYGISLYTS